MAVEQPSNKMDKKEKRTLQGNVHIVANGRTSYEIYYANSDIIFEVSDILVAKFGFSQPDRPIVGLDEVITWCRKGDIVLNLGWDNWSGFYMLAQSAEGDTLVQEIGAYLDTIIGEKRFEKYIHYW